MNDCSKYSRSRNRSWLIVAACAVAFLVSMPVESASGSDETAPTPNLVSTAPGSGGSTAAIDFQGDLTFGPNAHVDLQIGGLTAGSEYDQLNVTQGTVTLDGRLNVTLINGFLPAVGNVFPVINAATRVGVFDQSSIALPQGVDFAMPPIYDFEGNTGLSLVTALPGDADLNRAVALGDLGIVLDNLGTVGGWQQGNFDGNSGSTTVALGDLGTVLDNLGRSALSPAPAPTPQSVPEPTTLGVLTLGLLMGLRRRR